MKLIIGNKNYSSWSLRGWLAAKQSGLHFEEITVPMLGEHWENRKQDDQFQPSSGKVGRDRFWPKDDTARGMARAMVAEMHSSYASLRKEMPMNVRRRLKLEDISEQTKSEVVRILQLWAEARARHGSAGPFLFGTFGAADIFYAPVVSRFITYGIGVPGFAQSYMQAVWEHDWMAQWVASSEEEEWVIEQYETVG